MERLGVSTPKLSSDILCNEDPEARSAGIGKDILCCNRSKKHTAVLHNSFTVLEQEEGVVYKKLLFEENIKFLYIILLMSLFAKG